MGSNIPKQFLTLGGLPVLVHTLRVLEAADSVGEIILVVPEADREFCLREIVTRHRLSKVNKIVAAGGAGQRSQPHRLPSPADDAGLLPVRADLDPRLPPEEL